MTTHGGKRDGAGRKPLGEKPMHTVLTVRVTREQKENFKARGASKWLRATLDCVEKSKEEPAVLPIPQWAQKVTPLTQANVTYQSYSVQAGFPSPAESYEEPGLDFNEFLIENEPATYVLRVAGYSMIDAGIEPGDHMIVDRSKTPRNGDIVVMQIDNEYTVKRYMKTAGGFYLKAENTSGDYPDIYPKEGEEWMLFGVVNHVIKSFTSRR